jgi:hypothetical protein
VRAAFLVAFLLGGCAGGVTVPERVSVPVPVPCVDPQDVPPRPSLRSETDLMSLPRGTRTLATWSERAKLEAYALQLEAIAQGCSRLPQADVPP